MRLAHLTVGMARQRGGEARGEDVEDAREEELDSAGAVDEAIAREGLEHLVDAAAPLARERGDVRIVLLDRIGCRGVIACFDLLA
jgi:hypothetical protein